MSAARIRLSDKWNNKTSKEKEMREQDAKSLSREPLSLRFRHYIPCPFLVWYFDADMDVGWIHP